MNASSCRRTHHDRTFLSSNTPFGKLIIDKTVAQEFSTEVASALRAQSEVPGIQNTLTALEKAPYGINIELSAWQNKEMPVLQAKFKDTQSGQYRVTNTPFSNADGTPIQIDLDIQLLVGHLQTVDSDKMAINTLGLLNKALEFVKRQVQFKEPELPPTTRPESLLTSVLNFFRHPVQSVKALFRS